MLSFIHLFTPLFLGPKFVGQALGTEPRMCLAQTLPSGGLRKVGRLKEPSTMPRAEGTSEHVAGPTPAWARGGAPLQKLCLHSELEGESELVGRWGTGRGNSEREGREVGGGEAVSHVPSVLTPVRPDVALFGERVFTEMTQLE